MSDIECEERKDKDKKIKKIIDNNNDRESAKKSKKESCRIYKYYLTNYTCVLIFVGRMGTQMLSLLLTYSMVSFYLYYTKFWYPATGFGSIVSVISIIIQFLSEKDVTT
jgi:hypothetical protein